MEEEGGRRSMMEGVMERKGVIGWRVIWMGGWIDG